MAYIYLLRILLVAGFPYRNLSSFWIINKESRTFCVDSPQYTDSGQIEMREHSMALFLILFMIGPIKADAKQPANEISRYILSSSTHVKSSWSIQIHLKIAWGEFPWSESS